jgi:rhodanese-related sulfurtransferase
MPTAIGRDEVQRLISGERSQLVEVLPDAEFEDEHLAGAISIPLRRINANSVRGLERRRPVIVYCYDSQ